MDRSLSARLFSLPIGSLVQLPTEDAIVSALARFIGVRRAARVLSRVPASALLGLGASELSVLAGMDQRSALQFAAARELVELLLRARAPSARSSAAVLALLPPGIGLLEFEVFLAVALDALLRVRAMFLVSKGGAHAVSCTAREILTPILRIGAGSLVVVHNHPSGDPTPSYDDYAFTAQLMRAADTLGVSLLDHIIVAGGQHYSFADDGTRIVSGIAEESSPDADPPSEDPTGGPHS